jgi:ATP-binding cassette subfamily A (ABC1) protein 3
VDPVARREIWEMISNMVYNEELAPEDRPCVILTTHSMEECEALCPRIGIMAAGRLRCLGSAQQLKSKFGQGFQVELKVRDVDSKEEDYNSNLRAIAKAAGVRPPRIVDEGVEGVEDEESAVPESAPTVEVFLNLQQTLTALQGLTGDDYLASKLNPDEPAGFVIHKEASSVAGVNMSTLASFATTELRMKNLNSFIEDKYPESVMRERQDTKARYEVKSKGVKIAIIFADIEDNKEDLKVSEYSVSQTSLEQVFNMHAAEAARKLQASEQQM